jgi:hypothetical protein
VPSRDDIRTEERLFSQALPATVATGYPSEEPILFSFGIEGIAKSIFPTFGN